MTGDIRKGYRRSLVGVPPSPGPDAERPVEHALRRGFSAPFGRSFLHIRAGRAGRNRARQDGAETGTGPP